MDYPSSANGEEVEPDDRVYQTDSGKMYIDTDEFVESDEGQQLISRFLKSTEEGASEERISKTMDTPSRG